VWEQCIEYQTYDIMHNIGFAKIEIKKFQIEKHTQPPAFCMAGKRQILNI
jgi:hypothetical protein